MRGDEREVAAWIYGVMVTLSRSNDLGSEREEAVSNVRHAPDEEYASKPGNKRAKQCPRLHSVYTLLQVGDVVGIRKLPVVQCPSCFYVEETGLGTVPLLLSLQREFILRCTVFGGIVGFDAWLRMRAPSPETPLLSHPPPRSPLAEAQLCVKPGGGSAVGATRTVFTLTV